MTPQRRVPGWNLSESVHEAMDPFAQVEAPLVYANLFAGLED